MDILEVAGLRPRPDNWTVINLPEYDVTRLPLDFKSEAFDAVFSEHFIEHLYRYQAINYIKEAYRLLKPGGVFRTACPTSCTIDWLTSTEDLSNHPYVTHYTNQWKALCEIGEYKTPFDPHRSLQENVALCLLHQDGEHKYLWYVQDLIHEIECNGFVDVIEQDHHTSYIDDLNEAEDWRCPLRRFETKIIEARKPTQKKRIFI